MNDFNSTEGRIKADYETYLRTIYGESWKNYASNDDFPTFFSGWLIGAQAYCVHAQEVLEERKT